MSAILYEHEDGRQTVAIGAATFTDGEPKWHRVGPVEVHSAVSDELAHELTGHRPAELSTRDAAIIRDRAKQRWAHLMVVASKGGGASAADQEQEDQQNPICPSCNGAGIEGIDRGERSMPRCEHCEGAGEVRR